MADRYVVNVDSWGSSPMYRRGDVVPDDCPYDVEDAKKRGRIVSEAEYRTANPDWDPEKAEQIKAAAATGRDVPTAADLPDPDAEKALYEDAAKEAEPNDEARPVQVQQPSTTPTDPPTTSTRRTSSSS